MATATFSLRKAEDTHRLADFTVWSSRVLLTGAAVTTVVALSLVYRLYVLAFSKMPDAPGRWVFDLAGWASGPFRSFESAPAIKETGYFDFPAFVAFTAFFAVTLALAFIAAILMLNTAGSPAVAPRRSARSAKTTSAAQPRKPVLQVAREQEEKIAAIATPAAARIKQGLQQDAASIARIEHAADAAIAPRVSSLGHAAWAALARTMSRADHKLAAARRGITRARHRRSEASDESNLIRRSSMSRREFLRRLRQLH